MKQRTTPDEHHKFDNTLKNLFGDEAEAIIPRLIKDIEVLDEQNIEIDRTRLRADLVKKVLYQGKLHILNMELQVSQEHKIVKRLLHYSTGLHYKYDLPVISVILYPFEITPPTSPYVMLVGGKHRIFFDFDLICLWELHASDYVQQHAVELYTVLPCMKGATPSLLVQALREMVEYYSEREALKHHLIRFEQMIERTTTMTRQEKRLVMEELLVQKEYDFFIDENRHVKQRVARARKEALAKGEAKGEAKGAAGLRSAILTFLRIHYPALADMAQEKIEKIQSVDVLTALSFQFMTAHDDASVRHIIDKLKSE